jgi:methyl-accepting chemotaxis protein
MGQVEEVIGNTSHHFENLVHDFEDNSSQLSRIASAIEELSVTNLEIHRQVTDIHGLSKGVSELLEESNRSSTDMNKITEGMLGAVTRFRIGNDMLETMIEKVRYHRDRMQAKMQEIADSGVNVFDRHYQPIPNTNPQKYKSSYDAIFQRDLIPMADEARRDLKTIYSVPVDVNGYLVAHHSEIAKPMTGDPKADLIYSRQQRIFFSLETEKKRSTNTKPFLLQTYMRDTGAIVNDLSMPIYVNNQHWGAIVVGFTPDRLKSEPASAPPLP